jgi:hypothetical protein
MKALSERNQVRNVLSAWVKQYGTRTRQRPGANFETLAKLEALDTETATAADVAAIIGNTTWVRPQTCDECRAVTWQAVQVGEEPDYESATAIICVHCLRAALNLLGAVK